MRLRTDEDWAALHELYAGRGLTLEQLSGMTFWSRSSISRHFKRLGLPVRRRGRRVTS